MTVDLNDVGAIERELESEKEKEGFLDVVHRLFVASVRSEARSEFRSRKMTASGSSNEFLTGRYISLH